MLKMEWEMWKVESGKGKAEFGMRNVESSGKWKVESNKEVECGIWNVESKWKVEC